jgi:hypothetical protein
MEGVRDMDTVDRPPPTQPNAIEAARMAIWRLFQLGYVDEDMATAGLLAVDLGTRRAKKARPLSGRLSKIRKR